MVIESALSFRKCTDVTLNFIKFSIIFLKVVTIQFNSQVRHSENFAEYI